MRAVRPLRWLALLSLAALPAWAEIGFLGGDGSSIEQAILIRGAAFDFDGMRAEYD